MTTSKLNIARGTRNLELASDGESNVARPEPEPIRSVEQDYRRLKEEHAHCKANEERVRELESEVLGLHRALERALELNLRREEEVAKGRRALIELEILRQGRVRPLSYERDFELEQMLSVQLILKAKRYWDKAPRLKAVAKAILFRMR